MTLEYVFLSYKLRATHPLIAIVLGFVSCKSASLEVDKETEDVDSSAEGAQCRPLFVGKAKSWTKA